MKFTYKPRLNFIAFLVPLYYVFLTKAAPALVACFDIHSRVDG